MLSLMVSCSGKKKELNERITLWREDKIPYGIWYTYQHINQFFPDAEIYIDRELPSDKKNGYFKKNYDYEEKIERNKGKITQLVITPNVFLTDDDLRSMLDFVYAGNHLFLSSFSISYNLLDTLKLKTAYSSSLWNDEDSLSVSILDPVTSSSMIYKYPGKACDNYFTEIDTLHTAVLGRNSAGNPNFIRIRYENGGSIFLHLAPLAFSNFFLLHKQNKDYCDKALSYLPKDTKLLAWAEGFRNRNRDFSAFGFLLRQPPLAIAFWLLLLLMLLIYLFESKRKQRVIPLIPPLRNTSLDFVKTIGRLYFQRRDNKNLAYKMIAHFLDHSRNRFNIRTSAMDEEFEKRLAYKTGFDQAKIKDLVYYMKQVQDQPNVSDGTLASLHQKLENFYNATHAS